METLAVSTTAPRRSPAEPGRGRVEYRESGDGTALVLVPGSFSTAAAWRGVAASLRRPWRVVATSLAGYGETDERRDSAQPRIEEEIEILVEVIERAGRGRPVHVVGHSFGAQIALATAVAERAPLASLCLIEPPCPGALRLAGDLPRYAEFRAMTERYSTAWCAGERDAGRHVIDFYGGTGSFAALAPRVRDFVVATTPTNLLDWELAYADAPSARALATVEVPTLVVRGALGHPAVRRSNELIARALPNADLVDVPDAGHFMIATHAASVAALVETHATGVPTRLRRFV